MATANYGWLKEYDGSTFFPGTKPAGNSEKPVYIGTSGLPAEIGHTIKSDVPENAEFTDTKVTQKAAISTDGEYPVILANSTVTTEETNTVNKTNTLKYNPSTKTLTTDTIDINSLKLNQDVYHFTDADGDIIATINSSGISATQFNGPATKLGTVDKGSTKKPIYLNDGVPTEIGYTIESNVPSNAEFTDTKVTSAANHYTPTANTASALSVDASSTTAATWGSTDLVTGVNIQRDAKGHVTGLSVDSIQMPAEPTFTDTNTTYDLTTSASTTDGKINLVAGGSGSGTDTITIKGSGATTVTSDASGNITISSTDTNTTYSLSGASTDDNSTYTVTLTPSSGSATTAKVPAATDTVAGLMTANQVQNLDKLLSENFTTGNWTPVVCDDGTIVDEIYEAKGWYMKLGEMITVTFYYKGKLQQRNTDEIQYLALDGESLPFVPDGNILLYAGGGYVNGVLTYQQNYTFGGWTIDTYNKKIYPRVFPNSDAYPSIIDSSYCKAPPSGSPGIVYLSGSITYHIGEWATEPDPDASVAPTIPSIAFLYNGETTGWQSTWPQSDHSIPADYSSYTTNSGSCTNGYLTTGTASGYYSNTTIGSSNKINFQTLMDAGYTTLNVTFNKITWPFTTNLANNIVQFQYNMWVGIADSANENISFKNTDIITPLRGQEEKGGFTGLTFGANVTSATTATLSLVDLTKNSTRTNGHLVFGVIHPNTDNSASLEIQIGKIWVS